MNSELNETIQASTRYISSEVQDLMQTLIFGIPYWKWLALLLSAILLYFIRFLIFSILKKIKNAQTYFHDKSFMQFFFQLDIERGLSWAAITIIASAFVKSLSLTPRLESNLSTALYIVLAGNLIHVCYLAVDAFGSKIQEWAKLTDTQIDDQLAPLATKTLKVLVVIVGVLVMLQNLGVNVTALLAGLGIGGVALAFAAQDTVANVFGTITILLDTPFKLGDRIKLGDTEGIVEEVGFRSTRIRTFYNSLVTLPNSMVAKEKIDNFSQRDNMIRFRIVVGVTYAAQLSQIAQFCKSYGEFLKADASVDPTRIIINLDNFADSSINILVNFHYRLNENEFEAVRNQNYLEAVARLVSEAKLEFAFPTRTVLVQTK